MLECVGSTSAISFGLTYLTCIEGLETLESFQCKTQSLRVRGYTIQSDFHWIASIQLRLKPDKEQQQTEQDRAARQSSQPTVSSQGYSSFSWAFSCSPCSKLLAFASRGRINAGCQGKWTSTNAGLPWLVTGAARQETPSPGPSLIIEWLSLHFHYGWWCFGRACCYWCWSKGAVDVRAMWYCSSHRRKMHAQ